MFIRPVQQDKQTLYPTSVSSSMVFRATFHKLGLKVAAGLLAVGLPLATLQLSPYLTGRVLAQSNTTNPSGLPVPRFVSLKAERINMRIGPGRQFKVVWLFQRKGLPMEVIQEYDNWRKVRDPGGDEGWILHSLLSGKRTVIINPGSIGQSGQNTEMRREPDSSSDVIAKLEAGVVAEIKKCQENWCEISIGEANGHVRKRDLWGVYPDELIE